MRHENKCFASNFRVRPEHVDEGIKLECTASIGAVYWQSFQEKIPVVPRIEESTSSSNWWRTSSGATSSSFVRHANVLIGMPLISRLKIYKGSH